MELIKRLINDEEGQGLVEYGLIIAFIAIVTVTALTTVGTDITNKLNEIANAL